MIKNKNGFTLIELIVVTAIISLLASIAISFVGTSNQKASDTGKIRALQETRTALNVYFNDSAGGNGSYPNDINILVEKKYIQSINGNIKYNTSECTSVYCKNYKMAVPLSRTDNKITYGTKSDCNALGINSGICYFVSSNSEHTDDLPYIIYNGSKLYISPIDNSTDTEWGWDWYWQNDNITNANDENNGLNNTIKIVDKLTANGALTSSFAAGICSDLILGGYDDWYLPSKNQLNTMYLNKNSVNISNYSDYPSWTNFAEDYYWSSTAGDLTNFEPNAWLLIFFNGNTGLNSKDGTVRVRCVR